MKDKVFCLVALLAATGAGSAGAAAPALPEPVEGFLCCNMQVEDGWVSDLNARTATSRLLPAGSPVRATGYGRHRVKVLVAGRPLELGNDYSRKVELRSFAQRYIVAQDPALQMADWTPEQREAVRQAQVLRGMSREQVLVALGYPVADSTPDLASAVWKYFPEGDVPVEVEFGTDDRISAVRGPDAALALLAPSLLTAERLAVATAGERPCALNVYYAAIRHWNTPRDRLFVYVDDRSQGTIGRSDTLCLEVAPGPHLLSLRETAGLLPLPFKSKEVPIEVRADQPLFYRYDKAIVGIAVLVGPGAGTPDVRASFEPVSEASWRARE